MAHPYRQIVAVPDSLTRMAGTQAGSSAFPGVGGTVHRLPMDPLGLPVIWGAAQINIGQRGGDSAYLLRQQLKQMQVQEQTARKILRDVEWIKQKTQQLNKQNISLRGQIEEMQRKNDQQKLQNELQEKTLTAKVMKMEKRIGELEEEKTESEKGLLAREKLMKKLQKRIEDVNEEREELERQRKSLQLEVEQLLSAHRQTKARIEDLMIKDSEKDSRLLSMTAVLNEQTLANESLQEDLDKIELHHGQLQETVERLYKSNAQLQAAQEQFLGDKDTLLLGQMACVLEKMIFAYVFPQLFDPTKDVYTIARLQRTLRDSKKIKGDRSALDTAKKRWIDLQKVTKWSDNHAELIKELKEMRLLPAHPPVPDIAELREAVRRAYGPDEEMTSSVTELVQIFEAVQEKIRQDRAEYMKWYSQQEADSLARGFYMAMQ